MKAFATEKNLIFELPPEDCCVGVSFFCDLRFNLIVGMPGYFVGFVDSVRTLIWKNRV